MRRPDRTYDDPPPCSLGDLVGHLALYREPPGLRVIVRVLAVTRNPLGHDDVSLEAVVSARSGRHLLFRCGERFEVSGPPGKTSNLAWLLHRLAATQPIFAIDEAIDRFGRVGVTFGLDDLPS